MPQLLRESVVSLPLVDHCLREQRQLTVVERFAEHHVERTAEGGLREDDGRRHEGLYRDLIPLSAPAPGQQYAFQVDLDVCTGCQACVTACHRMNGLDVAEGETWRAVGSLQGETGGGVPVQMTVTAACHHCVEPACMTGCPVGAYEKDLLTGIVRHLDDQCIGCQYCMLTCPYEVPQFNERLGIVRKCDMCAGRLEAREEPACVQACPNGAISIQVVEKNAAIRAASAGGGLLPGAPSSALTAPSTRYLSTIALGPGILPADYREVRPAKAHAPLAIMLVLTQWSVGALLLDLFLEVFAPASWPLRSSGPHVVAGALLAVLSLAAGTLHLGRPLYAFRALIGLRTSWLSREILMFGLFAPVALLYAAATGWSAFAGGAVSPMIGRLTAPDVSALAVALGGAGILCSVKIYAVTGKLWWSAARTAFRFAGTCALLGASTALASLLLWGPPGSASSPLARALSMSVIALAVVKLAWESAAVTRPREAASIELFRTALLLRGELHRAWCGRVALGLIGVVVPLGILIGPPLASVWFESGGWTAVLAIAGLLCAAAGEIGERTLFFRAVSGLRMPGRSGG